MTAAGCCPPPARKRGPAVTDQSALFGDDAADAELAERLYERAGELHRQLNGLERPVTRRA